MQLGDLAVLIGSMCAVMATFTTLLMRTIKASEKGMSKRLDSHDKRFDGQDKQLAELKTDVGELGKGMAAVETHLSYLKPGFERMAGELGEVKGELKRIAPIERVGADK